MTESREEKLLEEIRNNTVHNIELSLYHNSEIPEILETVLQNNSLDGFEIFYEPLSDESWQLLSNIIRNHPNLYYLHTNLTHYSEHPFSLDNVYRDLISAFLFRNSRYNLPNIEFPSGKGKSDFGRFLTFVIEHCSLEKLDLSGIPLGDENVDILVASISCINQITEIDCRNTRITVDGIYKLYNHDEIKNRCSELIIYHNDISTLTEHTELMKKIQQDTIEEVNLNGIYEKKMICHVQKNWDKVEVLDCKTHDNPINPVCMKLLSNNFLAAGCVDKSIKILEMKNNSCTQELKGHTARITCLEPISDKILASGSQDRTIRIWDIDSGNCLRVLQEEKPIMSLSYFGACADKEALISASETELRLWNYKNGEYQQPPQELIDEVPIALSKLDKEPSYRHIFTADKNGNFKCWKIHKNNELKKMSYLSKVKDDKHNGLCCITFTGNINGYCAASGSTDNTVAIWKLSGLKQILTGHTDKITALKFLPHRPILVSGSKDCSLIFWHLETLEPIYQMQVGNPIAALETSSNGDLLFLTDRIQRLELSQLKLDCSGQIFTHILQDNDAELTATLSALIQNSSVKTLNLTGLTLNNDQYRLAIQIIQTHPDLDYSILLSLKTDSVINKVNLNGLPIDNNIVDTLIEVFSGNTTIIELDLEDTQITLDGAKRLYETVKDREPALEIHHDGLLEYLDDQQELEENDEDDDEDDEINSHSFVPGF